MTMCGNAENKAMGIFANFSGKLNQLLWPTLKKAVEKGEIDLTKISQDDNMRQAIRHMFPPKKKGSSANLGLNIGHVTEKELANLDIWDLKFLYKFFYQEVYGLYLDFPDELMPEASNEFSWPICMLGSMSNEMIFNSGNLDMPRWKFADEPLDTVMQLDRGRDSWTRSYIVRTPPDFEAGEKLKNISGNDIEKRNSNVLMFREGSILVQFIFWLTGIHLDQKVVTLTGSRDSDGNVLGVDFFPGSGRVGIGYYVPDCAGSDLRFRQSVS